MDIRMLNDWILVRAVNHKREAGSLVASLTPEQRGEVRAVGTSVRNMKKGDTVAFLFKESVPYQFEGVNYSLIKKENVVGIIKPSKKGE